MNKDSLVLVIYTIAGVLGIALLAYIIWPKGSGAPLPPPPPPNVSVTPPPPVAPPPPPTTAQQEVRLYYYNPAKDRDSSGNIMCSKAGLVAVTRQIPKTITPIQDSIRLLLQGELTPQERALGITTEYPLEGVSLKGAALRDGTLTLELADPNNRTGGGSCRVSVLRAQVEETARQFSGVERVRFLPEELFQP